MELIYSWCLGRPPDCNPDLLPSGYFGSYICAHT